MPGERTDGRRMLQDSCEGASTTFIPRSGNLVPSHGHTANSKIAKIVKNRLRQMMEVRDEDFEDVGVKERRIESESRRSDDDDNDDVRGRKIMRSKIPSTIPRFIANSTRSCDQKVIFFIFFILFHFFQFAFYFSL